MALGKEDLDRIELYAGKVAEKICEKVLLIHIQTCPHGKSVVVAKAFLVGALVATGVAGGGVGAALMKFLMTR